MLRKVAHPARCLIWACTACLALLFALPAVGAPTSARTPKPGGYCPSRDVLLVVAEELSASLELVMRSRTALVNKDQSMAMAALTSAGTSLHLAASRGAAARTILLIDAALQAKTTEDYVEMLAWFPVIQASLLTLPQDATVNVATDLVGHASDIMQGDKGSDALQPLREARHMLACDRLDIPLQGAIQAQESLLAQFGEDTNRSAYVRLIDTLRSALVYVLGSNE
jgi:hypothetical protein